MKKLLFLLVSLAVMTVASAQLVTLTSPGLMTNGATANVGPQKVVGAKTMVSAVVIVTKGTGTVAGNANLQGSHDNTNWFDIGTQVTLTDVATQAFGWKDAPAGYQWYRIRVTTTGTQTSTPTGTIIIRK